MAKKSTPTPRGKYRPEDFIVAGQDQNGNSVRLWCRVPPIVDRAVDILVSSKRFPFKTKGDFLRWSVKRGVDELDTLEPILGSVMEQVGIMIEVLRDEEHNYAFLTLFNSMGQTIAMHVQAQAIGEAQRVIAMMKSRILKMEDGYWKDRYLKELDSKFGHLIKGAGKTKLGDHSVQGEVDEEDYEER